MNGDLISREAVLDKLRKFGRMVQRDTIMDFETRLTSITIFDCINIVKESPAVDAVEVVRCKDCVYRGDESECPMCWTEWFDDPFDGMESVTRDNTTDDGFCHCGAKMDKEGEANEQGADS